MRDEKLHAVVARNTFRSNKLKVKTPHVRITFGSWDVEKWTPLWREAYVQVKRCKTRHVRTTFGLSDVEK